MHTLRRLSLLTGIWLFLATASIEAQTVAGGSGHTVVLKPDGSVWSFGLNSNGQLGDNTTTTRKSPIAVSGLPSVVAVAAGSAHSLALTAAGDVWAWGDNLYGQLGDASVTDRKTPVLVGINAVVAIAAGEFHSVALRANGDVYTWGRNANGNWASAARRIRPFRYRRRPEPSRWVRARPIR